jgi:TonB family protein
MFLLFLATLLAARPSNLSGLFTADDVPIDLITQNKVQTVAIAVTVGPDGKVLGCSVEASSGNPKLDSYTCNTAARRAKFSPPPTYLVRRTHVDWWVGDGYPPKSSHADLALTVTTLPSNIQSPVFVDVMFAVDPSGNISRCRPEAENEPVVLVSIACEQLAKTFRPRPARSKDGNPVASEQNARVMFEAK